MQFLQNVAVAFDKGDGRSAVRLLAGGVETHTVSDDEHLADLLVRAFVKDRTQKLADAFATHPCFYCSSGMNECDFCGGTGRTDRDLCGACLGLGRTFCDVCNGSGWATIEFVPVGLLLAVVVASVRHAHARIENLLSQPMPSENPADPMQAARDCAHLLVELNRTVGALENAVIAVEKFVPPQSCPPETRKKIVSACVKTAREADHEMQAALRCAAQAARHHAQRSAGTPAEDSANRAAEFYERFAKTGFARTRFEHPVFQQSR